LIVVGIYIIYVIYSKLKHFLSDEQHNILINKFVNMYVH